MTMANPRLLLFGTPGAGKSALLGALRQAAPTLKAEVTDKAGQLDEIHKSTYADEVAPTKGLETYDLSVKAESKEAAWAHHRLTVLDCSGKAALDMLKAESPFARSQAMRRPVFDADVIVLAVDASASSKQLGEEFTQFGRWLKELSQARGYRTDIADLPIYLVLTKCDKLARPDLTFNKWMQRIDEAKRRVEDKFRDYLKDQGTGFGTVQLHMWGTSIKRPQLADRPAKADEPFNVAELFRQCLESASAFQERRHRSQNRLQNVLVGLGGLIAVLGLVVALLFEFRPPDKGISLEEEALALLPRKEANPVERLQGGLKKLQEKRDKLQDPKFTRLSASTRESVTRHVEEIGKYIDLYQLGQAVLKLPLDAKNEKELQELEKGVNDFICPPEWTETTVGRRAVRCQQEFKAIKKAAEIEQKWHRDEIEKNNALLDQSDAFYKKLRDKKKYDVPEVEGWKKLREDYLQQMRRQPETKRDDPVPGVTRMKVEDLSVFTAVKDAREDWERSRQALRERSEFIQDRLKKK